MMRPNIMLWTIFASMACNAADTADNKQLYDYHCSPCHAAGPSHPGTMALSVKYGGNVPAELTQRQDLNAAFIEYMVRHGGGSMPFFRKTEISDLDLQSITSYLTHQNKNMGSQAISSDADHWKHVYD